jgi:uncharacterized protein with GYD domain
MPKFLIMARYTAEGMKGLLKDKASGREKAVAEACGAAGGRLEAMYYALGEEDVYVVVDMPDAPQVAGLLVAIGAAGAATTRTVPLMTIAEMDQALSRNVSYRAPGR